MAETRNTAAVLDRLDGVASRRTRQLVGVLTFAILTAVAARLSVPIPGTQVPFTFQPLAVLLSGALLGARLGAASQVLYLAMGIAGLPVFAFGYLFAPTGGYLMAYPLAAFVTGVLLHGALTRGALAMLGGLTVIYAGGVAWLALLTSWEVAFATGLLPFILPDLVKAAMALVIARRLGDRSRALFGT